MRRRSISSWLSPGPPRKPKPPRWRSKMRPRPHQARALIGERGKLDLEAALVGARARAENLEDQAGAVDDLAFPGALEIALLHRRDRGIDDRDRDALIRDGFAELLDRAAAEQRRRPPALQLDDLGRGDLERDRRARARPPRRAAPRASARPPCARATRGRSTGMKHQAAPDRAVGLAPPLRHPIRLRRLPSASKSWIGCAGITVEIACL